MCHRPPAITASPFWLFRWKAMPRMPSGSCTTSNTKPNRTQSVLLGMHTRTFGPYSAAIHRILYQRFRAHQNRHVPKASDSSSNPKAHAKGIPGHVQKDPMAQGIPGHNQFRSTSMSLHVTTSARGSRALALGQRLIHETAKKIHCPFSHERLRRWGGPPLQSRASHTGRRHWARHTA
jgi:hypothetical protein